MRSASSAATALIVSLGVVTRPVYLVVLEAAVGLLVVQAIIINRLTGVRYPFWASLPAPKIGALASRGALQRFTPLPLVRLILRDQREGGARLG
jgi:CBS-domain-containing membrane protein